MSDKAANFLLKHWFSLLSVLSAAIIGYADLREHKAQTAAELRDAKSRLDHLEKSGSAPMRERLQAIEQDARFADKRLIAIETEARATATVISDFKADLRFVVEWVKEQKRLSK